MFWRLRNRYIEILTKNNVSLEVRKKILKNADEIGIFDNFLEDGHDLDTGYYERLCHNECKKIEEEELKKDKVLLKIFDDKELIEEKLLESKNRREIKKEENKFKYGRNKLHEAIILRDINSVKEYSKDTNLLFQKDNNNLTPTELSYYEDFMEAFEYLNNLVGT